jgi:hypothetical protein
VDRDTRTPGARRERDACATIHAVNPGERLAALEDRYLAAREARDRFDVARATGRPDDASPLREAAATASAEVHALLDAFPETDVPALSPDDRRALAVIRSGIATADAYSLPVAPEIPPAECDEAPRWQELIADGGEPLRARLEACYAVAAAALPLHNGTLDRLQVLDRLATEPDGPARRELFMALAPLWRVFDGEGAVDPSTSAYRRIIRDRAPSWKAGVSSVARNAAALGVSPDAVRTWALTTLAAWRAAVVEPSRARGEGPVEPWDWWWRAAAAARLVGPIPSEEVEAINRGVYASLGADLDQLGVEFDMRDRPGRPPIPIAFTSFASRPHRRSDGTWWPARTIVMGTSLDGGLTDLGQLLHETGHAIHLAGIRTRPAFADWPDSDALTEALADLVAFDLAEPAWQRRWLGGRPEVPEPLTVRSHYASVVLDAAWALFEVRLLENPSLDPNAVWTELTSVWLGIAPHPEWAWWAMRGQLVQEPGYIANYAIGAVLTAAMRAAVREQRGDWTAGDRGWYAWMRERVLRFGLERPSGEVVRRLIGAAPSADALLADIARAARLG